MIDERSSDGIGWAKFSDDRRMRYRLSRALTRNVRNQNDTIRVVFVMLNPSTADAFIMDPTVRKCAAFAQRWNADVLEVVNLFAMRSPYPKDLLKFARGDRGDDVINDNQIVEACTQTGHTIAVAAWGNHGTLDDRHAYVRQLLRERHIDIHHLGLTQYRFPKHPLARGKHFIPIDTALVKLSD
jgi:hypothetical protein